jgi:histidine triad (HIT) family protein
MQESIFTKIVNGEIPCHKVYEDDKTLAFMDIHPIQDGHMLVIPKEQIEFVWDLPEDVYVALMMTTKKVALRMREVLPFTHVHERIVGTDVPHAHIQLIPFNDPAELRIQQNMNSDPDHQKLAEIASRLQFS